MAKVVFTQKPDSIYDDLPEERYHFPKTYLNQVEQGIGDWVVYYRPRRGSGAAGLVASASSYFAVAKLVGVVADQSNPDLFYAKVTNASVAVKVSERKKLERISGGGPAATSADRRYPKNDWR